MSVIFISEKVNENYGLKPSLIERHITHEKEI